MAQHASQPRWSVEQAQAWREAHGWLVGANFLPSTAGNQLEMWQAQTFDPETIDRELGMAAAIGMNVMRVYLHDLVFEADRAGLFERMERYLSIADGHGIGTMFVLLDDCWSDEGELGPQPEPIPGVHNSTWLRCPVDRGVERALSDPAVVERMRSYVCGVLDRFRDDRRVVAWDLYNEPINGGRRTWRDAEGGLLRYDSRPMGERAVLAMIHHVFDFAEEVDPVQPATVCLWTNDWVKHPLNRAAAGRSDIPSFHCYADAAGMRHAIETVAEVAPGRPMICSEYLARGQGSMFQDTLPIMKEHGVAAINWGLVAGRSNTIFPWSTWDEPDDQPEPEVWHHDVFRVDGSAYDAVELEVIRSLTGVGAGSGDKS
ncbi:MAG: 1,4-beta-xylanase [Planctomycetota bacterium]